MSNKFDSRKSLTISEFCDRHKLPLSTYYRLHRKGLGPKRIGTGRFIRIPVEAESEWLSRLEEDDQGRRDCRNRNQPARKNDRERVREKSKNRERRHRRDKSDD